MPGPYDDEDAAAPAFAKDAIVGLFAQSLAGGRWNVEHVGKLTNQPGWLVVLDFGGPIGRYPRVQVVIEPLASHVPEA